MRPPDCLVGVIRPLCVDRRLQSDHPINPLSRPIFVALLKSLPFDGVNRLKGVDLGFVESPREKLRDKHGKRNKDSRNGNPLCCYLLQKLNKRPAESVVGKNTINKRQINLQRRPRRKPMRRPTMPLSKQYRTNAVPLLAHLHGPAARCKPKMMIWRRLVLRFCIRPHIRALASSYFIPNSRLI